MTRGTPSVNGRAARRQKTVSLNTAPLCPRTSSLWCDAGSLKWPMAMTTRCGGWQRILRPRMQGAAGGAVGASSRPKPGTMVPASSLRGHLLPGDRVIVKFANDPGYGHERLILWPVFAQDEKACEWVILTEAGDLYSEGVEDWTGGMITTGLAAYPARNMPEFLVQFTMPVDQAEVLAKIKLGRAEAQRLRADTPHRLPASVPINGYDWEGRSLIIPKAPWLDGALSALRPNRRVLKKAAPKGPTPPPAGAQTPASFEAAADHVWLASETTEGVTIGTELKLGAGCFVSGSRGTTLWPAMMFCVSR